MRYFQAQIKRTGRYFFPVCVTMGALILVLGLICGVQFTARFHSESRQKLKLAITGDASDDFFQLGINVLEEMDASRYTVEFVQMDEASAKRALENQEISGYLLIPDQFVQSVMSGENKKITVVVGYGRYDVATLLVEELAKIVSSMITESQAGIYAYTDWARANGADENLNEDVLRLNLEYFNIILPRNNMYAMDTPDSQAVISLGGYYFSAVFLLLFMFMGITGAPIMIRKDRSLYQLMAVRGCGSISQVLSEYGAWCLLMLVFYVIISVGAGILEKFLRVIPELDGGSWAERAEIFAAMALMIPVLAAMHFFLYQLTGNLIGGVLLGFCVYMGLGYLSGCFYPLSFFPETVQEVSNVLPPGLIMEYIQDLLTGTAVGSSILGLAAWTLVFLAGAWGIRSLRIRP